MRMLLLPLPLPLPLPRLHLLVVLLVWRSMFDLNIASSAGCKGACGRSGRSEKEEHHHDNKLDGYWNRWRSNAVHRTYTVRYIYLNASSIPKGQNNNGRPAVMTTTGCVLTHPAIFSNLFSFIAEPSVCEWIRKYARKWIKWLRWYGNAKGCTHPGVSIIAPCALSIGTTMSIGWKFMSCSLNGIYDMI